ncbi:autotransporter assembly complex protein TamA [Thiomicrorhabdus aquaedulcis]|uniref:autotransporter assembly complex protein TamA n=1 Tax=Thiomicrorhabdus aquaedulcis TaxID=2211106 RepID=UPI000FDA21D5|nr:BamA/TamA family outer membrane protein [Thiomicrorhabdus aquaedulcis]
MKFFTSVVFLFFLHMQFNVVAAEFGAVSQGEASLKHQVNQSNENVKLEVVVDLVETTSGDATTPTAVDNMAELSEKLKNEIGLIHLKDDEYPAQTDFLYRRAENEILDALRALGYYSSSVTSQLERLPKKTRVTFNVELGKPVYIRDIHLNISGAGKDLPVWAEFQKFQLQLKKDAIFKHQDYTDTVSALTNIATNEGYMDAKFTQREFKVYPHLNVVDVNLHFNTQEPYRFGVVFFHGSQQIGDAFLNRYVDFKPGDIYKQSHILALQKALIDSQYFGLIRVAPQYSEQEARRIPIDVELEDSLKHLYEIGVGYGTDTGARVLFGFENRLVNSQGHSYKVESLFGEKAQNFNFNYRIPGERPAEQNWNAGLKYDATQSTTLDRELMAITGDYSYQITPKWSINPFISLETEEFTYENEATEQTQTFLLGSGFKNRWVNSDAYPTQGYHHSGVFRASVDNLVSDSQFAQIELKTRWVYTPMEFWRFHVRAQTRLTLVDKNQSIPSSYLTLLGGETLRGFEFESIGIQLDADSVVGAKNSVSGSLGTDYRITKYFGLGSFVDMGQLFDDAGTQDLKVGAGFGLRGYTPVGMAKLDIAWPVSEYEQPWRIHFSLGFDL